MDKNLTFFSLQLCRGRNSGRRRSAERTRQEQWRLARRPQEAGRGEAQWPLPGPSENMSMWFMDWFNLQATRLSPEGFAASVQVSKEIKTEYRRYFLLYNSPWFFPPPHPLILLGLRNSSGKFTLLFVFYLI